MALPLWLSGILTGGLSIIKDTVVSWLTHRQRLRELKQTRKLRKLEAEIEWDTTQARASYGSWKDEYWTLILSIPLIMSFIPSLAPYVKKGFDVLAETPDWYKAAVGVAIAAGFGFRQYANWTMRRRINNGGTTKDKVSGGDSGSE